MTKRIELECLVRFKTGFHTQQLRAALLENAGRSCLLLVHGDTIGHDAAPTPTDTRKISAFTFEGEHLWQHDVGRGE